MSSVGKGGGPGGPKEIGPRKQSGADKDVTTEKGRKRSISGEGSGPESAKELGSRTMSTSQKSAPDSDMTAPPTGQTTDIIRGQAVNSADFHNPDGGFDAAAYMAAMMKGIPEDTATGGTAVPDSDATDAGDLEQYYDSKGNFDAQAYLADQGSNEESPEATGSTSTTSSIDSDATDVSERVGPMSWQRQVDGAFKAFEKSLGELIEAGDKCMDTRVPNWKRDTMFGGMAELVDEFFTGMSLALGRGELEGDITIGESLEYEPRNGDIKESAAALVSFYNEKLIPLKADILEGKVTAGDLVTVKVELMELMGAYRNRLAAARLIAGGGSVSDVKERLDKRLGHEGVKKIHGEMPVRITEARENLRPNAAKRAQFEQLFTMAQDLRKLVETQGGDRSVSEHIGVAYEELKEAYGPLKEAETYMDAQFNADLKIIKDFIEGPS